MMLKKITLLLLALSINIFYSQFKENWYKIDSLMTIQSPVNFNGVIVISQKGKSVYTKVSGYSDPESKTPLKLNDRFEIMSNTKQITSVLILQQVEKGKIKLQSPIHEYLPDLKQKWADSVTVHQLLNHTHGIVDLDKPLIFKSGSDFKYGNISNILLGKILYNVTGKTYRQLAEKLFKKLRMNDTYLYSEKYKNSLSGFIIRKDLITKVGNSMINEENLAADGVVTTAQDLVIWNDHLHKGKLLSNNTYKQMIYPSVMSQHDVFGQNKNGYGYNIRTVDSEGIKYFGHTGLGDGFSSLNIYIPQYDISLIVLENQMNEESEFYYYFEKKIKNIVLKNIISQR